jgi:hypothetical protein
VDKLKRLADKELLQVLALTAVFFRQEVVVVVVVDIVQLEQLVMVQMAPHLVHLLMLMVLAVAVVVALKQLQAAEVVGMAVAVQEAVLLQQQELLRGVKELLFLNTLRYRHRQ